MQAQLPNLETMQSAASGWTVETDSSETTLWVTVQHPDHERDHCAGQHEAVSVLRTVLVAADLSCPTRSITHSGGSATLFATPFPNWRDAMSEVTHTIEGDVGPIHACVDKDATCYATGLVHVMPRDGGVWLTATDNRFAVMIPAGGSAQDATLAPPRIFAKRGGTRKKPLSIVRNGEWRSGELAVPLAMNAGRYPQLHHAAPDFSMRESIVVRIDAKRLALLADAIRGNVADVALIIPHPDQCQTVSSCIGVLGENGFGLIMPVSHRRNGSQQYVSEYQSQRELYRADFNAGGAIAETVTN